MFHVKHVARFIRVKQGKFITGLLLILGLGYFVGHLEFHDPYRVSSIIYAASMTPAEIAQDPLKANTLTPEATQKLYDVLKKVASVLNQHQIDYWITCATLLGAVRHEAVIKIDDDIDLAVWFKDCQQILSLKEDFARLGLGIYKDRTSIKIYDLQGVHVRPKRASFAVLPGIWFVRHKKERFPTLDVHLMCQEGDQIVCALPKARQVFINEVYATKDVYPLKMYQFGPLRVSGPANPIPFLCRRYGHTWNDVIYFSSRHTPGTGQVFKIPLTDQLRQAFYHFGACEIE
jgi:phosphorylcholine metabolism protein LicD